MEDGGCFLKKLFPIRVGDDILPCVESWLYVKNMKMDMNDLEPDWYQESHYCLTSLSLIWRSQSTGNCGLRKAIKPFPGLRFQAAFTELWSSPQRIGKMGSSELSWVGIEWCWPTEGMQVQLSSGILGHCAVKDQAESTRWELACIWQILREEIMCGRPRQARQAWKRIWLRVLKLCKP